MPEELSDSGIASRYAHVIKGLRSKREFTQKELAQLSGISESALRSYELSARKPKPETQERIVVALRVRPEYPSSPGFDPYMEFFYATPENEETPGHAVTKINDQQAIFAKPGNSSLFAPFSNCNETKEKLKVKEITQEEYEDFKETYEGGIG